MENLIIIGLSKTANHVFSFVKYHKLFNIIGFAVNKEYKTIDSYCGLPVYCLETIKTDVKDDFSVFIAMLWNHLNRDRKQLYDYCKNQNLKLANLVSPLAVLRSPLKGDNCWIHDYVIVQNNTTIESDVAIMGGSLIGANAHIGAHCFFGAQTVFGGGSTIGERSFVGIKATIFDDTIIGKKCIIGACTAVKRNMPDFSKYSTASDNIIIKQYSEEEIDNKLVFSQNKR